MLPGPSTQRQWFGVWIGCSLDFKVKPRHVKMVKGNHIVNRSLEDSSAGRGLSDRLGAYDRVHRSSSPQPWAVIIVSASYLLHEHVYVYVLCSTAASWISVQSTQNFFVGEQE